MAVSYHIQIPTSLFASKDFLVYVAGWASEPVWMLCRRGNTVSLPLLRIEPRFSSCPARSLVTELLLHEEKDATFIIREPPLNI
jgi:hypothetical protein